MERTIDEILANLFAAIEDAAYGIEGSGQGYDVKIYGVTDLKELLASLGLIAPESSLYTLQDVYDAVAGFHYNDSSNFATLQTGILSVIQDLIVENSPVIDGGATAAYSIDENTTDVTTITATDPQSDALTYSISGGADAALFQVSAAGVLSFITAPDFEAPGDVGGDNVYDVTVTVSDGAQTDTQDIAVTVEDDPHETDVLVDFGVGDVTSNGNSVTASTVLLNQVEADGFTFSLIPDGDGIDYLAYHINGQGGDFLGFVPTGEDTLLTYGGVRIELTAGGTFDFGGFTLLGHARSESMHVTSYDAMGMQIGDTFDFDTSGETVAGGGSTYDGVFHDFDDEVANNEVAYVEITFDTVAGLASHGNFLDDFIFEI